MERKVLSRSNRIAVLSDFSQTLVTETFGTEQAQIIKIPGGVDLETYRPHPNIRALRYRLDIPQDKMIFLTVRRLVARMGIEELLGAFAHQAGSKTRSPMKS